MFLSHWIELGLLICTLVVGVPLIIRSKKKLNALDGLGRIHKNGSDKYIHLHEK